MSIVSRPAAVLLAAVVAFGLPVPGSPSPQPSPAEPTASWAALRPVRTLELGDHGVTRAAGVTWSDRLGALVVLDQGRSGSRLVAVTGDEFLIGEVGLTAAGDGGQVAADPGSGSVTVLGEEPVSVPARALRRGARAGSGLLGARALPPSADGMTYDARGELVLLQDGALVRPHSGRLTRTPVAVDGHDLRGLAVHPETGELITLDLTADRLLSLDATGAVTASYDATAVDVTDPRGLVVAPSGDTTDDPSTLSVYIADAGEPGAAGTVVETRLEPVGLAANVVAASSQIRTVETSSYDPPSPDPSGVVHVPGADRLFIVDGEVDEMGIFEGANIFVATRQGALQDTGVSQPWSNEPVGVGYDPGDDRLFVTDDDQREAFEILRGGDGRFGTADDTVRNFDTADFGNSDPEGVEYDPVTGSLWFADGTNAEVFRVLPGPDGRFGTPDDVESQFDIGRYGARDPEGIGYDGARDTLVVVDDSSDRIYELDRDGALLNTVDISAAGMYAAAGITVGPATSGTGRSYYVVARGQDNDNDPDENDGRLYEITAPLDPVPDTNQPPVVDAGASRSVVLPEQVTLTGVVTDDGRPDPPAAVASSWTQVSGPGPVSFADPTSPVTTASFATAGSYVLRLTATDGAATASDDVTVSVSPAGGVLTTEVRVQTGSDDAEQAVTGWTGLSSSDLELTTDGSTQQVVGVRFDGLQVPQAATITAAWVQFRTDETSSGAADLALHAEAADDAPTYQAESRNLTSRQTTAASVTWNPPSWSSVGETGEAQRTPDVSSLVQSVVGRPGWSAGNALALQVSGTGRRTAEAFEGGAANAPLLHVEYSLDGGGGDPVNQPPTVDAGGDRSVTLPDALDLDATVTDDGLPAPAAISYAWSVVSGPGGVTFTAADAEDTTASFGADGTYVLRLTAADGELSAHDDVTVTVRPEGDGGAGLPSEVPGIEIESHDHLAPVMDGNGNLYRVTEDTVANGNRPRMMKSSDGGRTWVEQDVANRPTTGDTEGGWMLQDGATIWFAWQKSASVHLTRFRTSDHPTAPDSYEIRTENVASPSSPGPQYASLARSDDGGLWVAYGDSPSGGPRSALVKRTPGGGYGAPIVLDPGTATTAPRLVEGADGLTHVFYKDHDAHRVYWRTLSSDGVLSAPVRVDSGGTSATETPLTNAVAYTDDGQQVLQVAFVDPAGVLKSVEIRGGVVGPEETVSASPVTIDPGDTTSLAAVAHLAVAGTTVVALWSDAADGDVYRDVRTAGGSWGEDVLTVDTGPGTAQAAWYVYAGVLSATATQARIGFTYDLGPHVDDDSNIHYDEVTVPISSDSGGGGGGGEEPVNSAPVVDLGPDRSVTLPDVVVLDAAVADDGLPSGSLAFAWSQVSGAGTAVFDAPSTEDTTVSFSAAGTYTLRLTVSDGELAGSDEVTVEVSAPPGGGETETVEVRVAARSDDAEQRMASSGSSLLSSSDLELTTDGKTVQVVGLRFTGLAVPQGATVTGAWVQFRTDEVSTGVAELTVRAEAADDAATYEGARGEITARAVTSEQVPWSPPAWDVVGEAGAAQRTPDLSTVVQAVVSRPGWTSGNALALQVTGSGRRTAEAFDGDAAGAPVLRVEYTTGVGGVDDGGGAGGGGGGEEPVNSAPVVDLGPDRSVTLPDVVVLDVAVADDGLPSGSLAFAWSQVSGAGTAVFDAPSAEDTTVSFSAAGTYALRLTVSDGELAGSDEVTVEVSAPAGGGGDAEVIELRIAAGTDDVEQALAGSMEVASSDLELTRDGRTEQVVGLRFAGVPIPRGATVTRAWLQFTADEVDTETTSLTLRAEAADDTPTYQRLSGDVTSRPTTAEAVAWAPAGWTQAGESGSAQRTPDLSALIQAVVSRPGWAQGNALALQVAGTGRRTAVSHDVDASAAPLLHVEFTLG